MRLRDEFKHHRLNAAGKERAEAIGCAFSILMDEIEAHVTPAAHPRHMALVKTHLETACFHARRALALVKEFQECGSS